MTLYKNVDICDLNSILKNGILPLDKCQNNNWEENRRVGNDTSVVYLFKPVDGKPNTFPNYGAALIEVDCDAIESKMSENDVHKDDYREYIAKSVKPSQIKKVIIPKIFKNRVNFESVCWCDIYAEEFAGIDDSGIFLYEEMKQNRLDLFGKTAAVNTTDFNFFRGVDEKREMIDLSNVRYIWK